MLFGKFVRAIRLHSDSADQVTIFRRNNRDSHDRLKLLILKFREVAETWIFHRGIFEKDSFLVQSYPSGDAFAESHTDFAHQMFIGMVRAGKNEALFVVVI